MERRFSFRWADRIHRRRDFQQVFRQGRRFASRDFALWIYRRPAEAFTDDRPRLGLVISRRYGSAVARNRVKRLVRETFRHQKGELPRQVDLIVQPKGPAKALTLDDVQRQLVPVWMALP